MRKGRDLVEVVPLNPISERYDRAKVRRWLRQWQASRPEAKAEILD